MVILDSLVSHVLHFRDPLCPCDFVVPWRFLRHHRFSSYFDPIPGSILSLRRGFTHVHTIGTGSLTLERCVLDEVTEIKSLLCVQLTGRRLYMQ